MQKVISIVSEKLRPVGETQVTRKFSKVAQERLAKLQKDVDYFESLAKECDGVDKTVYEKIAAKCKQEYEEFLAKADEIISMVTEYVDSKGAKYTETIEKYKGMQGHGSTPVRKLEKVEEEYLKDGRKIVTTTTHEKGDYQICGEGWQDGHITKIEEVKTKDGVTVGRRTTKQLASGYGGKTVGKEISIDGKELNPNNTRAVYSDFDQNGIKFRKEYFEPGTNYLDGIVVNCNEKGIPQPREDYMKPNW